MSAEAMLSLTVDLNIQPGEIPPSIHLKQESDSLFILLRIAAENATLETGGTAIVKTAKELDKKLEEDIKNAPLFVPPNGFFNEMPDKNQQ